MALVVNAGPPTEVLVPGPHGGGLSTRHTPEAVAFYLDQADRARVNGAYTAAVVMYRAALECFLEDRGHQGANLVARIDAAAAAQPAWLAQLDEALMHALRVIGNRAVHAKTVAEVAEIDRGLALDAELVFVDLLDEVYEQPARREERRQRLLG